MINELHTGIMTQFNDTPNDFYTSIGGHLAHAGNVPRGWGVSYAIFKSHSVGNDDTFDARVWNGNVQFTVFAASSYAAGTLLKQCINHFDGARLTVSGHEGARLLNPFILQTPEPSGGEESAGWQASVDFDVRYQES